MGSVRRFIGVTALAVCISMAMQTAACAQQTTPFCTGGENGEKRRSRT